MPAPPQRSPNGPPAWRLAASIATCTTPGSLHGRVDLSQPHLGVEFDLAPGGAQVLGVAMETPLAVGTLADGYERVADLVATYLPTAARPHRLQIYWQHQFATPPGVRGWIDLQVLTQTDLLDSDPRRGTISELPLGEVLRFSVANEQLIVVKTTATLHRDAALPCILVRPADADWSYVEMVHPLDFHATDLQRVGDRLQIRQALFVNFLEKGVILRSRVRGAIVDRRGDIETARGLYQQLCEAAPPLAT